MSSVAEKRAKALEEKIKKEIPGFRIDFKDTSKDWKLRVVSKIVGFFNKDFMTGFTTTLYPVIYFANRGQVEKNYGAFLYTICHEWVHLYDRKSKGFPFTLSYLMPQVLAVFSIFSILAIWSLWFLLFLLALLFLLPIRSPWRTKWELRGYSMNMAVRVWDNQPIDEEYMKRVEENFTGLNYFRMCPDGEKVREHLLAAQESARDSSLLEGEDSYPYRVVKTTMEEITK